MFDEFDEVFVLFFWRGRLRVFCGGVDEVVSVVVVVVRLVGVGLERGEGHGDR